MKAFVFPKSLGARRSPTCSSRCRERMAAYEYPRIVEVIDELSTTVSGKILRRRAF